MPPRREGRSHAPELDGSEATRQITADDDMAGVRVLILTTYEIDVNVLRAGVSGFLSKSVEPADLLGSVRLVAVGEALLSPKATRSPIARAASSSRSKTRPAVVSEAAAYRVGGSADHGNKAMRWALSRGRLGA
jgi:DNA-binding NarL/FixJ family response regulator